MSSSANPGGATPLCGGPAPVTAGAAAQARRPIVDPLAPDRYEIRFTAPGKTCEKLRLAMDLLRHAVPQGDMAEVIDRALTVLLEDLARKKFAATPRPTRKAEVAAAKANGRHIPASVKRAVWIRDGARCAFVGKQGRRCKATGFLEFHHVRPYAVGGKATAENIAIRCRAHNAYEADLFYGPRDGEERYPGVERPPDCSGQLVPERVRAARLPAGDNGGKGIVQV